MAKNKGTDRIIDIDVSEEMRGSFLEYAYSVIYSRALPDARDGLKPVQRRILFQMAQMGLRPDRGHVKSARVVGEVMGRLHPHGDSAIYDALVRMAQPFTLRVPLVDGHGNFGSPDDGPAAMRYTEARLAEPALDLTAGLDEDVVDFVSNYDGREREPIVLPAAFPNLLVNGAAGIAVGMATTLVPHNLAEVCAAARHLIDHPDASLEELMAFVPGPDFPSGGEIVGLDGVREAYRTGRGSFRLRASTTVESVTPRRKGIVVTSLPVSIGPERVIERIKDLVQAKKIQGISDVVDLTDGDSGLRLIIEMKSGIAPEPLLEQLYKLTPMEDSITINAVALVDGQPRTLNLRELLEQFVEHRFDVVRRRSGYRKLRAEERAHLVAGLLVAIVDIDEVIELIRASDDTSAARERLMSVFDLSEVQATYILDMPLRRLTKFSRIELEAEAQDLRSRIDDLEEILADDTRLRAVVSDELAELTARLAGPRRTTLLEGSTPVVSRAQADLEVADEPCVVLLSSTGLLARTASLRLAGHEDGTRVPHDVITSACPTTTRSTVGAITSHGRLLPVDVVDLPAIPPVSGTPALTAGLPVGAFTDLLDGEKVLELTAMDGGSTAALGTSRGVVKRVLVPQPSGRKGPVTLIPVGEADRVVGARALPEAAAETAVAAFVTSAGNLLHFPANSVRVQGPGAAGMAGISVADNDAAVFFTAIPAVEHDTCVVATVAGDSRALPGTELGSAKVTALTQYPGKGRGTKGVRCHKFRSGEDSLTTAWVGPGPARAASASGAPIVLPDMDDRRDGTGSAPSAPIATIAGRLLS
ncbi:MAG TPA: DNA topoisomerase IV subunit A [Acidimicrobiia bacterium]